MQHDYNGFPNQSIARQIFAAFPNQSEVIVHQGRDLLLPRFGTDRACRFEPNFTTEPPRVPADAPVIRDIGSLWDIGKHAEARLPVSLGQLTTEERLAFTRPIELFASHVLDMPIKFPGTDVRVPGELASVIPTVRRIVNVEAQLNPRYDDYYAYLSLHQGWVQPGARQRETPYHVDGFQGPRWAKKHPANHSYLMSDALPTLFYPIAFPLGHIDPNFDDVYAEFARRVEQSDGASWSPEAFELILMDCYCVHRGTVASVPVFRTWLRISWETRIFDRLGNTHNPLFDYDWKMVARDTDPRIRPRVTDLAAA